MQGGESLRHPAGHQNHVSGRLQAGRIGLIRENDSGVPNRVVLITKWLQQEHKERVEDDGRRSD